jgi:hypothetical protein
MMTIPNYIKDIHESESSQSDQTDPDFKQDEVVINNGFFPDLKLQDLHDRYAIDQSLAKKRQNYLLKSAMLHVNIDLDRRYCDWSRRDYDALSDVPQQQYGDEGELTSFYLTAVFAKTMQLLLERYRATDTSRYGLKKAEAKDIDQTGDEYEAEYRQAIRNIIGQRGQSIFVDLI